jgi:biotin carboxylase
MIRTKKACIVDAYSTGAQLAPLLNQYGWTCIHVQSAPDIPEEFLASFRPQDFERCMLAAGSTAADWDKLASVLEALQVDAVIVGTETGVVVADYLADKIGVAGNSPETSMLRRNKFAMQDALRNAGLRSIKQLMTDKIDEALAWAKRHGKWPIVVKPIDSAGADSVRFCHSEDDVRAAFDLILNTNNKLGLRNSSVLLQERLRGRQYIVNAVSLEGKHVITEIWSDDKLEVSGAALICEKEELLPYQGAIQDELKEYISRVLTVLGVSIGPSHSELMLTEQGPVLIETAARMQGTILHQAVVAAIGDSHVTTTVECYLDPTTFARRLNAPYELKKNLYCVTLASEEEGIVKENHCDELLSRLPSFEAMFHTPGPGEKLSRTTDLFTNPGIVYLCHHDQRQIETDYRQIRAYEKAGRLFSLYESAQ